MTCCSPGMGLVTVTMTWRIMVYDRMMPIDNSKDDSKYCRHGINLRHKQSFWKEIANFISRREVHANKNRKYLMLNLKKAFPEKLKAHKMSWDDLLI
ncbi:hypothetical protein X798_02393, partial [Onchocerca flexuosa]